MLWRTQRAELCVECCVDVMDKSMAIKQNYQFEAANILHFYTVYTLPLHLTKTRGRPAFISPHLNKFVLRLSLFDDNVDLQLCYFAACETHLREYSPERSDQVKGEGPEGERLPLNVSNLGRGAPENR